MTSEQRKQILHDLKHIGEAANLIKKATDKLIKDLDEIGEAVVSDKG